MADGLWGITTAEWTAIGTIVTAGAASVALVLNGWAGKRAHEASEAARDTAAATREAAAAQMAAMPVEFEIEVRVPARGLSELAEDTPPIRLHVMRQNVYVHRLTIEWAERKRRIIREPARQCEPDDGSALPVHVAAGEYRGFAWPGGVPERDSLEFSFEITYGFVRDAGSMVFPRTVRPRKVGWPD